mgnify:CR=1 FL=1
MVRTSPFFTRNFLMTLALRRDLVTIHVWHLKMHLMEDGFALFIRKNPYKGRWHEVKALLEQSAMGKKHIYCE